MFRNDGYRAPKVAALVVMLAIMATVLYILQASRQVAKAGSGSEGSAVAHVRRIEQAQRDAQDTLAGRPPKRHRSR